MHPRESRRQCRAGGAGRLCRAHSTVKLLVGQGGRTTIDMTCALHVGWTTSEGLEEFVEGEQLKEGKTQDGRDRCMDMTLTTLI